MPAVAMAARCSWCWGDGPLSAVVELAEVDLHLCRPCRRLAEAGRWRPLRSRITAARLPHQSHGEARAVAHAAVALLRSINWQRRSA